MLTLSAARQAQARAFIMAEGRPLDQALYRTYFEDDPRELVLAVLADFQNADGGFGHGLEPDIRLAESSVICTTVALQHLRELGAGADHPLVQGAIGYLLATYDAEHMSWLPVPPNVDDAPHAPWWTYQPDPVARWHNPRPEIAGYFVQYARLVPAELRERLLAQVISDLEALPDKDWADSHDDLLCYVRLAETPELGAGDRQRIVDKLRPAVRLSVPNDPAGWAGYVLMPLKLVPRPDALFAEDFTPGVQAQLDREIAAQGEDGAWMPGWSWASVSPEGWADAEREWKGRLTLDMLRTLRAFGRMGAGA